MTVTMKGNAIWLLGSLIKEGRKKKRKKKENGRGQRGEKKT